MNGWAESVWCLPQEEDALMRGSRFPAVGCGGAEEGEVVKVQIRRGDNTVCFSF